MENTGRCSQCGKVALMYDLNVRVGYRGRRIYTCVDCQRKNLKEATAHICISMASNKAKELSNSIVQRERR